MGKCAIRIACALGIMCVSRAAVAGSPVYDLGGVGVPSKNTVITYDGNDGAIANVLVGADIFYNSGIFGQNTISANIEAGAIWGGPSGHQDLTLSTYSYAGQGALGEVDRHATWVGAILGGLNYNQLNTNGSNSWVDFGIAPLTFLASGSIATKWVAPDPNPDHSIPSYSGSFDTTQEAVYTTYNRFMNTNAIVNAPIDARFPLLGLPDLFISFSGTADVINSSWGFEDPTGMEDFTKTIDGLARSYTHTTMVFAAGNYPTPPTPSNSVIGPASGYNAIAVGATKTTNSVADFTTIADFSTRGPQDYYDPVHGVVHGVRAAVDLVAPGTTLAAAYYGGQSGGNGPTLPNPDPADLSNDLYNYPLAGTSFAAPIVSGGVALLDSTSKAIEGGYTFNGISVPSFPEQSRDARVIKALLMNTADKLPGWDNGQHFDAAAHHIVTTQSLDWVQGTGQLNLTRAFLDYVDSGSTHDVPGDGGGIVAQAGFDLGALSLTGHNDYLINVLLQGGDALDVTLTWFRDRIIDDDAQIGIDNGQANLDLQIWSAGFGELLASSESLYNTSEHLHYLLPDDGAYGIRVVYTNQLFGADQLETFGLAWDVIAVPEPGMLAMLLPLLLIFRRSKTSRVS